MEQTAKRKKWARVDPWLYIMLVPALILLIIYSYGPLFGLQLAFKEYDIAQGMLGSPWVGLDNFSYIIKNPNFSRAIRNTLVISAMKLVARFIVPIVVAILLNELRGLWYKKTVQTAIYLPYFISWVVISGILINVLSPTDGAVNEILKFFGAEPVYFLGNPQLFPLVMVISDVWKEFGFGTILYMAALTGIDPSLYEAASIDRASRFQQIWYITIPGIVPIMVLVGTISLGSLLNAGFDQIFNLYNPMVYSTGDILDTLNYRMGIAGAQYDVGTAIGLIKSAVSLLMVSISYFIAYKLANYRIF